MRTKHFPIVYSKVSYERVAVCSATWKRRMLPTRGKSGRTVEDRNEDWTNDASNPEEKSFKLDSRRRSPWTGRLSPSSLNAIAVARKPLENRITALWSRHSHLRVSEWDDRPPINERFPFRIFSRHYCHSRDQAFNPSTTLVSLFLFLFFFSSFHVSDYYYDRISRIDRVKEKFSSGVESTITVWKVLCTWSLDARFSLEVKQ